MSRPCRFKVELIQLGSAHEKYGIWTRPKLAMLRSLQLNATDDDEVDSLIKEAEGSDEEQDDDDDDDDDILPF